MPDVDLAVLFDMDGLLIDSEPVWFEVESVVFARLGAPRPWTHADAAGLVGNQLPESAGAMVTMAMSERPVDQVVDWLVQSMAARLDDGIPWKPGALRLLGALRDAGVPTGLVSSSYRRLVDTVLRQAPPGSFATSIAGDEVARGKPHPEPYLRALDALGTPATSAVVVEDSPTGATAAEAAGCRVVVVPDLAVLPRQHAWHLVDSLEDLDVGSVRSLLRGDGSQDIEVGGSPSRHDGTHHAHDPGHHQHREDQRPRDGKLADALTGERDLDGHPEGQS